MAGPDFDTGFKHHIENGGSDAFEEFCRIIFAHVAYAVLRHEGRVAPDFIEEKVAAVLKARQNKFGVFDWLQAQGLVVEGMSTSEKAPIPPVVIQAVVAHFTATYAARMASQ